ncbi:MAG: PDZ domain-containing protein, partial [Rickettsiales bacterium]|nr:PDZ domain-containing protein [Rickettsiales bacterium]
SVNFIAPPETPARDVRTLEGAHPLSGIVVANLSPALATELEMQDAATGVVVLGQDARRMQVDMGLMRGDIIVQVGKHKITSTAQLADIVTSKAKLWQIAYLRGGNLLTLTVRMP